MGIDDPLVSVIFQAMKKEKATPNDRRLAIVRAGLIAQMYADDSKLTEKIFGPTLPRVQTR